MTCIVGISNEKGAVIAAESMLSTGDAAYRSACKYFELFEGLWCGMSGLPIVEYIIRSANIEPVDTPEELALSFASVITKSELVREPEFDAIFVAGQGRLWSMDHAYAVCYPLEGTDYLAIGSGEAIALGSLYSTSRWGNVERRAVDAVSAACRFSLSCGGTVSWKKVQ